MKPLKKWIFYCLPYAAGTALYALFLALLPQFNRHFIPCLVTFPGQLVSYAYKECNITLALDRFLALALTGFVVAGGVLLMLKKNRSLLSLIVTITALAGLAAVAYYRYVPVAEAAIRRAPIVLESLK